MEEVEAVMEALAVVVKGVAGAAAAVVQRDLAWSSRHSLSRSFWSCLLWWYERLMNFLLAKPWSTVRVTSAPTLKAERKGFFFFKKRSQLSDIIRWPRLEVSA